MRLLLVEDETRIGKHLVNSLDDRGFQCQWVTTGREAEEYLATEEFDCIILDRRLPDMDGLTICRNARNQNLKLPILMLTALTDIHERVNGLDAGADDYVTKPFSMDELTARVHALIRRTSVKNTPNLKINNIELDTVKRIIKVNEKPVQFSNREFLLLEYLMRNAGKPVTRSQIYEHVWEVDMDPDSNLVDVYINYVRKKIDSNPSAPSHIETLRGYGYRFSE